MGIKEPTVGTFSVVEVVKLLFTGDHAGVIGVFIAKYGLIVVTFDNLGSSVINGFVAVGVVVLQ